MSYYLVTFKPVQPWYFGEERSFNFGPDSEKNDKNYYVKSRNIPQQTSILGAIKAGTK